MAVKAEPPDQIDQGQRAFRLGETGSREILVHEPLRQEPSQQSLTDPVLQVHVGRFDPGVRFRARLRFSEKCNPRIFKDDRSNRATGIPRAEGFAPAARATKAVERLAPRRVLLQRRSGEEVSRALRRSVCSGVRPPSISMSRSEQSMAARNWDSRKSSQWRLCSMIVRRRSRLFASISRRRRSILSRADSFDAEV